MASYVRGIARFETPGGRVLVHSSNGTGLVQVIRSFLEYHPYAQDGLALTLINPPAGGGGGRGEPPYPAGVTPPPSRYKTGYGNEPYVITPPWSQITAYDLNTGKIKWQTPYGDLPQAGPSNKLRGNVYPKSGFVITAGGLVLFAGNDSKLYALDRDNGKVVMTKDLPNGSLGVPAVYEVDGREYILLAVTGGNPFPVGGRLAPGGVNPPAISKSYIAFALPK